MKIVTSTSKYVRSDRKFKIEVDFGSFSFSFRNMSVQSGRVCRSLSAVVALEQHHNFSKSLKSKNQKGLFGSFDPVNHGLKIMSDDFSPEKRTPHQHV